MSFYGYHPIIEKWFRKRFQGPTEPQQQGWPCINRGEHTLISAPTGSGKTLTAFLSVIDRLVKRSLAGDLDDETSVIYVSPLRALSNDMHRNLEQPLEEISQLLEEAGEIFTPIRIGLRTGDTPSSKRAALVKRPPHILVTTPESLYLMLTGSKARETLKTVETVIVDEIHALLRDKRGSHWSITLERLEALVEHPLQRIGLSATQKPLDRVAQYLVGHRPEIEITANPPSKEQSEFPEQTCRIVNIGHSRTLDVAIQVPPSELSAICSHEQWAEVLEQIIELINSHRSTLIFVNTRRLAERITHQLTERLGEEVVGSHHGSLSAKIRHRTEQKLKSGELKAVIATASLELGIDVGYIDLVVQIGSPRGIATFLQRIGRSGHSLGLVPKGRIFALSRDELVESMALVRSIKQGILDTVRMPEAPIDILAQQITAEVACQEWNTDELFDTLTRAYSYRNLKRKDFDSTIQFLSEGISSTSGRSRVYLHHDQVQNRVRSRKNARLVSTMNGGAIPEIASYRVVTEEDQTVVGSVDEEFAVESMAGDIFLLGNTSWQVRYVRGGDVTVVDAHGAPPSIPFWFGEAPGRSLELSTEISHLRKELERRIEDTERAILWLSQETNTDEWGSKQIVEYFQAQKAALGVVPTQKRIVFERFFDESGGMQLVIHAPFGGDINRAWGYTMRKRFCRSYNFELQATADDNGIILSLGPQHSFPLESLFSMLNTRNVQQLSEQAILDHPMFHVRWRWNVTRALLVSRMQNGKKVPPPLQRFRAEDLLTAVFPRLTGCPENEIGEIVRPDHILVDQTLYDCLNEQLDIEGLKNVLLKIEQGSVKLIPRDTREPSPFCYELLNSSPYTFLDGGEAQERRARAVATRHTLSVESVEDLGRLSPEAIAQVCQEAQPVVRNADEFHDVLLGRIHLPVNERPEWSDWYQELEATGRATTLSRTVSGPDQKTAHSWVATERLPAALAAFPESQHAPHVNVPAGVQQDWESTEARTSIIRGLLDNCGPQTVAELANQAGMTDAQTEAALMALEGEGIAMQGYFRIKDPNWDQSLDESGTTESKKEASPAPPKEWCHRRLLSRIHRLTLQGLRAQVQPVDVSVLIQYLTRLHGLTEDEKRSGTNGLFEVLSMLQGIDIPAICWERDILPARLSNYQSSHLDELCFTGEVGWGRLYPPRRTADQGKAMTSITRNAPVSFFLREDIPWLACFNQVSSNLEDSEAEHHLSSPAQEVQELLTQRGALFASDLMATTQSLPSQIADSLGELISRGLVTSDSFSGMRQFTEDRISKNRRSSRKSRIGLVRKRSTPNNTGRWSIWRRESSEEVEERSLQYFEYVEQWAWQLIRRWGVVFRDLLSKESGAPRWFELLQIYRRLEARGEIRGGRFVTGVAGEQFAMSGTIQELRKLRDAPSSDELTILSATDPLNLTGILTKDARVPATPTNRIAYRNGNLIAWAKNEELFLLTKVSEKLKRELILGFGLPIQEFNRQQTLEENSSDELEVTSQSVSNAEDQLISTGNDASLPDKKSPRPSFL
ncbi:DEAD/DEAH box helicase [Gimesia maris]|uniref:ATP-dependent RNA helicase RhlE n=1 Tax=Gimesia maris TaxID=122 RepID=A0ABX5YPM8_9PLAN|nr:DEAD/DEAH box helicase [Gimesia maris]EDL58395.1 DEAD/DEAH box helicase-like protein [Gimesia maris DSM 8797]QEG17512.1 ATP-dependent RNA helicase RhlE [Gimesia maris]QGQ29424.1 DEAD/DEAH box helicase [Gimesia maris]